jgi:hypothetical protein
MVQPIIDEPIAQIFSLHWYRLNHHFMRILFFALLLFFNISCMNRHHDKKISEEKKSTGHSSITVSIKYDLEKYLGYPRVGKEYVSSLSYDSITRIKTFRYNRVNNGSVPVSIFSILTDGVTSNLYLQKDTSISFDSSQYAGFTIIERADKSISSNLGADTIYVGQKINGCFAESAEKIVIYKAGDKYRISYEAIYSGFDSYTACDLTMARNPFDQAFEKFVRNSKQIIHRHGKYTEIVVSGSTNITDTYIRVGNIIYELPEVEGSEAYNEFRKAIGIKI